MDKNVPKKCGFYWARSGGKKYYNCIVIIHGEKPFLKIYGWIRDCLDSYDDRVGKIEIDEIDCFGPEIIEPKVPIDKMFDAGRV